MSFQLYTAQAGDVVAWGANYSGQRTVPSGGSNGIVAIAAGQFHSLALKHDGTVVAWGHNGGGQTDLPQGLNSVIAIAAGLHSLALKSDGTVVGWGLNESGQSTPPSGLSGVIAIAAAWNHSLALKSDGTVVAWGSRYFGESTVPFGLTGVVAIAAGTYHSLALKADGTVVAWGDNYYGQRTVPIGLSGVVAIAAGEDHSLALRSDGSVVAWGANYNYSPQTAIPAGLTGVIAIAAGGFHSLALKSDGTVIAWGVNDYGESTVPIGLTGVIGIAGGGNHSLALVATPFIKPSILVQPENQTSPAGQSATLNISATGMAPLHYQWRRNGVNIAGETTATLTLNSVTAGDSDCYSVVVWNSFGAVESQQACLAVLADGANGVPRPRITEPVTPAPDPAKDNLVLVTHGVQPNPFGGDVPWVNELANAIRVSIEGRGLENWQVIPVHWRAWAVLEPDVALINGSVIGGMKGRELKARPWNHVHLIGHSAGSALIQAIAEELRSSPVPPEIHMTFLDPYTSFTTLVGRDVYGSGATWADNYSVLDVLDVFGNATVGKLENAFNLDVTSVAPRFSIPWNGGQLDASTHDYPHEFYLKSVLGENPFCASDYGFNLSKEAGGDGWNSRPATGNDPMVACGALRVGPNPNLQRTDGQMFLNALAHAVGSGVSVFNQWLTMSKGPAEPTGLKSVTTAEDGVWFATAILITNAVNFIQFQAEFTGTNGAEGLFTVFWNTNQIGMADERAAAVGLQRYRFALPATATNGLYTLSFRLDSFNGTASSIIVTNVTTGFAGVEQPFTLGVISSPNRIPTVKLTGAANFNYLLQSSTNLVDWTPSALLLNTNGTVLFTDTSATNSAQRFYRALLP